MHCNIKFINVTTNNICRIPYKVERIKHINFYTFVRELSITERHDITCQHIARYGSTRNLIEVKARHLYVGALGKTVFQTFSQ